MRHEGDLILISHYLSLSYRTSRNLVSSGQHTLFSKMEKSFVLGPVYERLAVIGLGLR